jgi:tetratricopeptide (TPR) repeat protein
MKKVILLIIILLTSQWNFAQQKQVDSLIKELQKQTAEDTFRLNSMLRLSFRYYFVNADSGISYANKTIALAKKLNQKEKLAGGYEKAGLNYDAARNYAEAKRNFQLSFNEYEKLGMKINMGNMLNNIGNVYKEEADLSNANDYYLRALTLFEQAGNIYFMATATGNLGVVNAQMENYPQALIYYEKAEAFLKQNTDKTNRAVYRNHAAILNNMSNIYNSERYNQHVAAIKYAKEALQLYQQIDETRQIPYAMTNLGYAYSLNGNNKEALEYFTKALAYSKNINEKDAIATAYGNMANVYIKAPDSILLQFNVDPKEKFSKAFAYEDTSLKLFSQTKNLLLQSKGWETMSKIYEGKKDLPNALMSYKKYMTLHDSIYNDQKRVAILRNQMKYDQDKKDALNKAEILHQQTIRNFSIAVVALVIFASSLLFAFYKRRRDAKAKQQEAELKTEISETEMKALRSQMNPHFIFNSLNSIGDYISKNNLQAADNYLTKFAKLMRSILENSEQKEVPLSEDLKALELYMQLESLRLNNKFTYEIKVDENIDKENTLIPPLILQPFVENSIWHGIAKKEGNGKILVHIEKQGNMINCIVEDDGVGRMKSSAINATEKEIFKKSLGMKITKSRIDIINKIKKSNASVELSDLSQGLRAEVKLPLQLGF